MAALRFGISTVIIPEENRRDLEEIDPLVKRSLNFITAKTMDTVLEVALKQQGRVLPGIIPDLAADINSTKPRKNLCQ